MKTKSAIRSLLYISLTYFFLFVIYLAADETSSGGGLPMPEMSEFVFVGIMIFSLLAFIYALTRFFVKENTSPVGFILHGLVLTAFIINTLRNLYY